jgi:RNA polymerase sigma-70 factor, ECF subfamily
MSDERKNARGPLTSPVATATAKAKPIDVTMGYEFEATADMLLMNAEPDAAIGSSTQTETHAMGQAALIKEILAGDRDKFGKLYALYAPMVHGILLARVPRTEVDDLLQDIFLHALRKLHTLREPTAFGPWIAMIARNKATDFHRASRETVEVTEDVQTTDSLALSQRSAAEVLEIIRTLPDAYRETLVLRLVEGMTGPEIAMRTGLTPDSVRVNLHRGMKLVRQRLLQA